jgi:hypothetical protein
MAAMQFLFCRIFLLQVIPLVMAVALFQSDFARASLMISIEGDQTWQSRNDQAIPGSTGTKFSLSDLNDGPFSGYRVYLGTKWNNRHEIRALYAPLALEINGQYSSPIDYMGSTFAANTPLVALYKFNSYRLTYAYHFAESGPWKFALGFTGKIRDAEVRLTQGSLQQSKTSIGFVPLLNFQALRTLSAAWRIRLDLDAAAAPQGRAFDFALFLERSLSESLSIFGGYRTIEGGADNGEVYNFAWIHKAVLGLRGEF